MTDHENTVFEITKNALARIYGLDIFGAQEELIRGHELVSAIDNRDERRYWRGFLWRVGNGLAWQVLDPHTIRALYKHPGPRPA